MQGLVSRDPHLYRGEPNIEGLVSLRCKMAIRLVIRKKIWTADRLARRSLSHNDNFMLCGSSPEDAYHRLVGSSLLCILWSKVFAWIGIPVVSPAIGSIFESCCSSARNGAPRGSQGSLVGVQDTTPENFNLKKLAGQASIGKPCLVHNLAWRVLRSCTYI